MQLYKLFIPLLLLIFALGCSKDNNLSSTDDYSLSIISNSPVRHGDVLKLSVEKTFPELTYIWTLAPSIEGEVNKPNIELKGAKASFEGWYVLEAKTGYGFSMKDSVLVEVVPINLPCLPYANKLESDTNINIDFSYVARGHNLSNFEVEAEGQTGSLHFIFRKEPDFNETYLSSAANPFYFTLDDVKVSLLHDSIKYDGLENQYVHLTTENYFEIITLCDFTMFAPSTGTTIKIKARVITD